MAKPDFRKGVFVSYSHVDRRWVDRLRVHLAPYIGEEKVEVWDDKMISPGSNWAKEIEKALARARVAVLLVSPTFLASPFITSVELPAIIRRATEDLTIMWIPILASGYEATPLRDIQAAYDPSRSLASLSKPKQEEALAAVAKRIAAAMDVNVVANALRLIDAFEPEVSAFVAGKPEPSKPVRHALYAEQISDRIDLVDPNGSRKFITAEDLVRLDRDAQKLIRAYERTMKELFERWTELKPKRIAKDPDICREAREESDFVRMELCSELNGLLGFIESMDMYLQDHYVHVRYICSQSSS